MSYTSSWNKIVAQYNKNINCKEEIVQNSWEMLFSMVFNYEDSDIDSQRSVKMGVETKRADILIKNDNADLFVVELKRHTLHEGQEQLFSYLNQLKMDLGILVCDNLYIYDYDFTTKENSYSVLEIPFKQDNPNGIKFVELFLKENFDKLKIKDFIRESNSKKESEKNIRNELSVTLITDLLKNHFSKKYPSIDVDKILDEYNISVTKKSAMQTTVSSAAPVLNYAYSAISFSGNKDSTQYTVNGTQTGGKGPTVYAAVKLYVESHGGISFAELQNAFPDYLAKPGFGKMIRRVEEVTQNEWSGSRFNKHPIVLADGTKITVSTQWKPDNMRNFILGSQKIGIEIKPIS